MKRQALAALLVCLSAGALSAGFSLGRPAAVKKRVDKLDDKVVAFQAAKGGTAAINRAPVISGIVTLSTTVAAGGPATLTVAASDPDGDALSYVWTSTAGTISGSSTSASLNWTAPSSAGSYSVTCTVSDGKGGSALRAAAVAAVPPGTKKWEFATSSAITASPAIGPDGTIYIASADSRLYAIKPDGSYKWDYSVPSGFSIYSSPAVDGAGNIYFGADDGNFYSVSPSTGGLRWVYNGAAGFSINSSPAIGADGAVYFGAGDGNLYKVDSDGSNGGVIFHSASAIGSSPAIDAYGTVYVASDDGNIYAVDPVTASQKWGRTLGGGSFIRSSPAIGPDGTVYIGADDGNLYAVNYGDGLDRWSAVSTGGLIRSSPAIGDDGMVYAGSGDGYLYAINAVTGIQAWSTQLGAAVSSVFSSPVVGADGTIYIGSDNQGIYALDVNGVVKSGWPFVTGGSVESSPALGTDGTVYVGSSDKHLYALYGSTPLSSSAWPKFRRNAGNTGR